jgi:signal transduction histidine kinase
MNGDSNGANQGGPLGWGRSLFRRRGLGVQIVLWTVLPLTLVLIGVAFTGVYSHERAMRQLVQERDRALAQVTASQVSALFQQRIWALEELRSAQAFHHGNMALQKELLDAAGDLDGQFSGDLVLLDDGGQPVLAPGPAPAWALEPAARRLAAQVMSSQAPAFISTSSSPTGQDTVLLGIPVYDEQGTTYGILAGPVAVPAAELDELLNQVQVGEQGIAYLVDTEGQVVSSSLPGEARTSFAGHTGFDQALAARAAGATQCHAPSGEVMTLAYAPVSLPGHPWLVLVEQPWDEVVGPVLRYSQFMPLVAVLAAIVSLLALYYGLRSIVRPLQALGQQAEKVAWGDFEATQQPVGGVEEIEDLRRTLGQMARRIQNYQTGMHDYIAAITEGQEEERLRLARELHDDTAQSLIALNQQVEMAQKHLDRDPEQARKRLEQVRQMLAETIEGVRRFSRDLRPIYLEDLGFVPALEMLAREADGSDTLAVSFQLTGQARRLDPHLELAAYRIVQEALNNVLQHAAASQAAVKVRFAGRHLQLVVEDDGRGFEPPDLPDALARQGHFGLMGIQERVLLYGGQLELRSAPGQGTTVDVRIPYPSAGG